MINKVAVLALFSLFSLNLFSGIDKKPFCEPGTQVVCGSLNTSHTVWGSLYNTGSRVFIKACIDEVSLNDIRGLSTCQGPGAYSFGDENGNKKITVSQDKNKNPADRTNTQVNMGSSRGELFKMSPNPNIDAINFNSHLSGGNVSASCKRMADQKNAKEAYKAKVGASHNSSKSGAFLGCSKYEKQGSSYASGVRQAVRDSKKEEKDEQDRIAAIDEAVKKGAYNPTRKYYVVTKIKIGNYAPKTFEIKDPKKQSEDPLEVNVNSPYFVNLVADKSQSNCETYFPKDEPLPTYFTVSTREFDQDDKTEKNRLRANIPILDEENLGEFCNNDSFNTYEISMDREPGVDPKKYAAPVKYVITTVGDKITNVDKVKFIDKRNYTEALSYDYSANNSPNLGSFTPVAPENVIGTFVWDKDKKVANIVSSKELVADKDKI